MSLLGNVIKMDINGEAVEINKPLCRGVLLWMSRSEEPKWFEVHYEQLSFYYFACGIMGHLEIDCPNLVPQNELGKLPYDVQHQTNSASGFNLSLRQQRNRLEVVPR